MIRPLPKADLSEATPLILTVLLGVCLLAAWVLL
jgi:hypothetical protein